MKNRDTAPAGDRRESEWKGWATVWALAIAFLLYGVLMYVVIGDKGPPDWDFSVVEDIPGKSVYSTYPEPGPAPLEPEPQHVENKPAFAPPQGTETRK